MTRKELHALVDARYDEFQALQEQPNFMAYEKKFAHIMTDLGKDILQSSVGPIPVNTRKKQYTNPIRKNKHCS